MNRQCIINLHEMPPFKWDTAYFFAYDREIQKTIGVQGDFRAQGETSLFF